MRVLQLGPCPPPHGGVQANLSAIRTALLARGDTCPAIALTRSTGPGTDDGEVYRPKSWLQLLLTLLRERCEIVHLHIGGILSLRVLGLALVCTLLPRRKSVLTFHSGGYPSSPAGRTAGPISLRGFIFRRLDRIIAVNAEIFEMFQRFGVPEEKVSLIYPYALALPASHIVLPEQLQSFLQAHRPALISVGLLEREYDLPQQIEVLGLVRSEFPNAGLIMIGSGSLENDLRRRSAAKPYAEHILLCGDVCHDVTLRVLDECDLMLRTTLYDGDSISVREALHLGLPVIATDNGMRPAGVELIPASDLTALYAAINRRLRQSRQAATERTNDQANIRAVLDLYHELL